MGAHVWQSGREYDHAILTFFNKWPEFDYNREAEVITEFKRLCREKQWSKEERQDVKDDLRNAMVHRFNEIYGTNDKDLEAWKKLCKDVHVDPIPNTLAECEKVRNPQVSSGQAMTQKRCFIGHRRDVRQSCRFGRRGRGETIRHP